ncbi:AMP-binding protein [Aestuariimicrobium kwangyangense]|uniref:AMP-binding protein n=1 Tax=Aestuariimicrobium kwangyangense TaxID=396389 RepID=UPI0003B5BBC4|nr:AMP-binding protein [Aestuariimicrobium kwangyangense]
MTGTIRVCRPEELPRLIDRALDEEEWLVPLDPGHHGGATARLDWLAPDRPETSAGGGVIVTTSGSTGAPKGVCLPGSALRAGGLATQQVVGPADWVCALPLQYVAGLMTLVRARIAGHRFTEVDASLSGLAEVVAGRPAALSVVATQLHRAVALADEGVFEVVRSMASCRMVLVGGSAVEAGLLARARGMGIKAVTTYGMSETAGGCVYDGSPLPGVGIHLLGLHEFPGVLGSGDAPEIDEGRIAISGPMLFSGYRNRPDLTAETLVDGRVVTQDRGRWRQGRLRVLGRYDDVIISGGVNVDLAEVQQAVERVAPGRAAVVAAPDPEWGASVCLVVEGDEPLGWWRGQLRDEGLQAPALPKRLARVDTLPRTVSGKIDRQGLRVHFG